MLDLNSFINAGIKDIANTASRFYMGNRKGQSFMLHMAAAMRKSTKTRARYEAHGVHVPPFLIASIATRCNLSCAGCYARANGGCGDSKVVEANPVATAGVGVEARPAVAGVGVEARPVAAGAGVEASPVATASAGVEARPAVAGVDVGASPVVAGAGVGASVAKELAGLVEVYQPESSSQLANNLSTNNNSQLAGGLAQNAESTLLRTSSTKELSADDWQHIFSEAADIGVSFILLAGGEPLLREDVIRAAALNTNMLFPIFTNSTLIDDYYLRLFDEKRNLIPVLSIEGDDVLTDKRRGSGVSKAVWQTASALKEKGIMFGTSITVTSENKDEVTTAEFVRGLRERGCGLVFFVEYVPVEPGTEQLILSEPELVELQGRIETLRADKLNKGMILLSFPGDEEAMGGCLAAGRGFFHINANGAAEPCPFSPYSQMNLREHTLLDVLRSGFFARVREISAAEAINHKGGCTLFRFEDEVMQLCG